ncbi:MAG: dipeptidyl peptidase 3 [Crocinitomicaceae bacterium]|nr:dipeptidyl peptidase 3 [Crocinitomicaceae bacterium]
MKQIYLPISLLVIGMTTFSCSQKQADSDTTEEMNIVSEIGDIKVDRFADVQILRYEIKDFDKLTLNQKKLVYYLSQAGLSGRDINWDQNNQYNLQIRKAIESIYENYKGNRTGDDWNNFEVFAKQVWFSNGIHHHYGMDKFIPTFSKEYFQSLLNEVGYKLSDNAIEVLFNPELAKSRKIKDPKQDIIAASANGFYGDGVTQKMVEEFYATVKSPDPKRPLEIGLNSTLVLKDGKVVEETWKSGGKYGKAIDQIIYWLEKATTVAENAEQKAAIESLIHYYKTGDLKAWDDYNILWAQSTKGDIDWINGFIEVYGDALGMRANYESIIQITDFEASKQMKALAENAQWFEDNSSIMDEHKKKKVKGVSYKVVQVASESGDASPSTPIGVNLPNNNWIREEYGSKSVSLGNIIEAYNKAGGKGLVDEFGFSQEEKDRAEKHAYLGGKLHTALHEVIGHASGIINPGVGQPAETLKQYASTLEEARADLVGLYYIYDQKLIDLGLIPSFEVSKAEYDAYIRNGMMTQLQRLELGKQLTEEHMQNRQLVASWALEKGKKDNVIEKVVKDGKTYFVVNDYLKLRDLFGQLLKEIQRIKSEGDFKAGQALVDNYGVKVDRALHQEVLNRVKPLNIAPYSGFVNPTLVPIKDKNGEIIDVRVSYDMNFVEQMLYYGKNYSFID